MTADADSLPCGCMGKTPLDGVVRPARQRARRRLAANGVYLAGTLDCGLCPRGESFDRGTARVTLDGGGSALRRSTAEVSTPAWGLAAVLAVPERGTRVGAFADALARGYGALTDQSDGRLTIAKGHSVQIPDADRTSVVAELLHPRGERRPGYVAGNVDVIHAFPELPPTRQAEISGYHALNDCYAYGATEERVLRPVVCVPESADEPTPGEVRSWYRRGLSSDVTLCRPTIVPHGGSGWLFGATATAELAHSPPIHAGRLEPDDVVLLSRPLGAVAALSAARDDGDAAGIERAAATLSADHADAGRVVAALSPGLDAAFDPDRHLKLATDVSGPGIGGVASAIARGGHRLRVEGLPFVDDESVRRARRRWLVPDATVGTNGPIAMVGRSAVVDDAESRLRDVGCTPVRLGRVERGDGSGAVSSVDGVDLPKYIEDSTVFGGPDSRGGSERRRERP